MQDHGADATVAMRVRQPFDPGNIDDVGERHVVEHDVEVLRPGGVLVPIDQHLGGLPCRVIDGPDDVGLSGHGGRHDRLLLDELVEAAAGHVQRADRPRRLHRRDQAGSPGSFCRCGDEDECGEQDDESMHAWFLRVTPDASTLDASTNVRRSARSKAEGRTAEGRATADYATASCDRGRPPSIAERTSLGQSGQRQADPSAARRRSISRSNGALLIWRARWRLPFERAARVDQDAGDSHVIGARAGVIPALDGPHERRGGEHAVDGRRCRRRGRAARVPRPGDRPWRRDAAA